MKEFEKMQTLPGDEIRQIQWGYADRYDLQMLVQTARQVARGVVAEAVAADERNTHDWTPGKQAVMDAFDSSGLTAANMEPEQGGFIAGPKNLAQSLVAYEIAWVDAGAATGGMAGNLALSPIVECGTDVQRQKYMSGSVPGMGEKLLRGAFNLTEPLPYVGVDAAMISGTMKVAEWGDGEPLLKVEKRGRFITNMATANFVTAAVRSDDDRIQGSAMVILEEGDPGLYDRGTPTKKKVHQMSSTHDPVFSLTIPASRIIGGYSIKDGKIVPNLDHNYVIEKVFGHTRISVAVMTAAKLVSSVEPLIRYHRTRYRGADAKDTSSEKYLLGVQSKEDALFRLVDIWAAGEAMSSLGFRCAVLADEKKQYHKIWEAHLESKGIKAGRALLRELRKVEKRAQRFLELKRTLSQNELAENAEFQELMGDDLIQYAIMEARGNVLIPAAKLWNCGHGTNMMREAVSLMGGYGITEDAPGFLGHKWTDAQLEATYEGPEAVQRRQMGITMTNAVFLEELRQWADAMEKLDAEQEIGAGIVAEALRLFQITLKHLQSNSDTDGRRLYHANRQGISFPLADALSAVLGSYYQIDDVLRLQKNGEILGDALKGSLQFFSDLCTTQAIDSAGEMLKITGQLVLGYANENTDLHAFNQQRETLEKAIIGSRIAKDRAAETLKTIDIPEALDY